MFLRAGFLFDIRLKTEKEAMRAMIHMQRAIRAAILIAMFFLSAPTLTDNTTNNVPFFGIGFYASPVPVPGALLLLGSGLLGLLGIRRRRADA